MMDDFNSYYHCNVTMTQNPSSWSPNSALRVALDAVVSTSIAFPILLKSKEYLTSGTNTKVVAAGFLLSVIFLDIFQLGTMYAALPMMAHLSELYPEGYCYPVNNSFSFTYGTCTMFAVLSIDVLIIELSDVVHKSLKLERKSGTSIASRVVLVAMLLGYFVSIVCVMAVNANIAYLVDTAQFTLSGLASMIILVTILRKIGEGKLKNMSRLMLKARGFLYTRDILISVVVIISGIPCMSGNGQITCASVFALVLSWIGMVFGWLGLYWLTVTMEIMRVKDAPASSKSTTGVTNNPMLPTVVSPTNASSKTPKISELTSATSKTDMEVSSTTT